MAGHILHGHVQQAEEIISVSNNLYIFLCSLFINSNYQSLLFRYNLTYHVESAINTIHPASQSPTDDERELSVLYVVNDVK